MIESGHEIHFVLDAWGEHQFHTRTEGFHQQAESGQKQTHLYTPVHYQVNILTSETGFERLTQLLLKGYFPNQLRWPPIETTS